MRADRHKTWTRNSINTFKMVLCLSAVPSSVYVEHNFSDFLRRRASKFRMDKTKNINRKIVGVQVKIHIIDAVETERFR
jgi:hypothetical protein